VQRNETKAAGDVHVNIVNKRAEPGCVIPVKPILYVDSEVKNDHLQVRSHCSATIQGRHVYLLVSLAWIVSIALCHESTMLISSMSSMSPSL
jgi:hypothetical protein